MKTKERKPVTHPRWIHPGLGASLERPNAKRRCRTLLRNDSEHQDGSTSQHKLDTRPSHQGSLSMGPPRAQGWELRVGSCPTAGWAGGIALTMKREVLSRGWGARRPWSPCTPAQPSLPDYSGTGHVDTPLQTVLRGAQGSRRPGSRS